MEMNRLIDHTLLKADASISSIEKLCNEALNYHFASVCVNPGFVPLASKLLKRSDVKVCTVIGFPLGATLPKAKQAETLLAIEAGAEEIDMVINVSMAKEHQFDYVENEIRLVKEACANKILKVILETCLLTDNEIVSCCKAAVNAGADFVKTSTGFSKGGATTHAVKIMRETVGPNFGVKASGGIHSYEEALDMVNAGANRIGASCGVEIVNRK
ncbi:MAG: deoxyribose-phosphate aldolase [Bacillales bacterium]|nr:deoxyribose-phosphate aldolase [Bacillales bacterium]